ncbi:MAG: hypothetical protein HS115_11155 [Spirochaetales bacterium]|nr:hypothetical protein [Spirochaetales bacterium]
MLRKFGPVVASALVFLPEILLPHEIFIRGGLATGEQRPHFALSHKKDDLFGSGLGGATDGAWSGTWGSDNLRALPVFVGYVHPQNYYAGFDFSFQESNLSRSSIYNTRISGNDGQLMGRENLEKYRETRQVIEAGYRLNPGSLSVIPYVGIREWNASGSLTGRSRGSGAFSGQREFLAGHIQPGSRLSQESTAPVVGLRGQAKAGPVEVALGLRLFAGNGTYHERITTSFYNTGLGVLATQSSIRQTTARMKEQGFESTLDLDYPLAEGIALFAGIGFGITEVRLENFSSIHLLERESYFQERTTDSRSDFFVFDEAEFLHDRLTYAKQTGHSFLLRFGIASKIGL